MRHPTPTRSHRTAAVVTVALSLGLGLLALVPTAGASPAAPAAAAPTATTAVAARSAGGAEEPDWFFEPTAPTASRGLRGAREEVDPRSQDWPWLPKRCATRAQQIPKTPMKCTLRKAGPNRPTLVLWGDSHMWMMLPAVREAIKGRNVNLVGFLFGGCVPARPDMEVWAGQPCAETAQLANRYLSKLKKRGKKVRVILGSFWGANLDRVYYYPSPEIAESAKRRRGYVMSYTKPLFTWLGKQRIGTDVLSQGPIAVPPNPDCRPGPTPFDCDIPRYRAYYKEAQVRGFLKRLVKRLPRNARLIDYSDAVCKPRVCTAQQRGGVTTWYDPYHLSTRTTKRLARFIKPSVKKLVR